MKYLPAGTFTFHVTTVVVVGAKLATATGGGPTSKTLGGEWVIYYAFTSTPLTLTPDNHGKLQLKKISRRSLNAQ
jgi:hypothetical protein